MRINIIEPSLLTDQHLLAEYNELNMVAQSFNHSKLFKNRNDIIPKEYSLNTGHVKFFYDKGKYLYKRFYDLKNELRNRGFNVKMDFKNYWLYRMEYFNDWKPSKNDYKVIFERIKFKINLKPNFYRYKRNKINVDKYLKFLKLNLFENGFE